MPYFWLLPILPTLCLCLPEYSLICAQLWQLLNPVCSGLLWSYAHLYEAIFPTFTFVYVFLCQAVYSYVPIFTIFYTSLPNLSPVIGLTMPSFVWFLPALPSFYTFLSNFLSWYMPDNAKLYAAWAWHCPVFPDIFPILSCYMPDYDKFYQLCWRLCPVLPMPGFTDFTPLFYLFTYLFLAKFSCH